MIRSAQSTCTGRRSAARRLRHNGNTLRTAGDLPTRTRFLTRSAAIFLCLHVLYLTFSLIRDLNLLFFENSTYVYLTIILYCTIHAQCSIRVHTSTVCTVSIQITVRLYAYKLYCTVSIIVLIYSCRGVAYSLDHFLHCSGPLVSLQYMVEACLAH